MILLILKKDKADSSFFIGKIKKERTKYDVTLANCAGKQPIVPYGVPRGAYAAPSPTCYYWTV